MLLPESFREIGFSAVLYGRFPTLKIKHGLGVLVMVLKDVEFNRPLYYFTAPGVLLWGGGLTMGVSFLHNYNAVGQGLNFGPTILMILLIIVGTFMALTGVLLHSMSAVARKTEAA